MIYVVERYLPGLSHSDLLRGLTKLGQSPEQRRGEAPEVRYLGSTIVLGDEACFCQFEGPSEEAVATANRVAGLSFDRIVPAINVQQEERSNLMTVSPSIPTTIEMRRSRLVGVVTAAALVAALTTWALLTFAFDTGTNEGQVSALPTTAPVSSSSLSMQRFANGISSMAQAQESAAVLFALGLGPQDRQYVQGITSMTPAQLAAAFGGPRALRNLREEIALDALSPRERQYVKGITSLTKQEQAAAFGR